MNNVYNIPDLNTITEKYKSIIENYKSIYSNLKNIFEDIKVLEGVHNVYINSIDMSSLNYSIYVDDIKHQINITRNEYDYINKTYYMNIEKFYRDLFKLYNRVTKIILNIFKENKDTVVKIWNSCEKISSESSEFKKLKKCIRTHSENARSPVPIINDNKIFDEIKKQFYMDIVIYNEMGGDHKYDLDDVMRIYDNLIKRLDELYLSRELIKMNLLDIQNKTDKGVLGQTFVMDLNGKSDRINVDYSILVKILESIIGIHTALSEKYKNMAQIIADQVNYNEETSEILSMSENGKNLKKSVDDLFYSKNE
jgi:hypothetical protein